ncbi:unnamed protein product [Coffea canephora]|uniref:DH200=94 genomic scaffold, scaffold_807 n=1 Tax=Coffea canephora TaxID=49390 RepID=A0A068VGX2_COFCA|nr:unnamed protein product [Coffea canephora]
MEYHHLILFNSLFHFSSKKPSKIFSQDNSLLIPIGNNQDEPEIQPAIQNTTIYLRYIYLSSNKFNSAVPSSLGSLGDLLHLDLSSNYLSGSLPSEIGSLKAATLLNVSMNQISGIIPSTIGGMQDVIDLSLAFNRFEGPIPRSIRSIGLSCTILNSMFYYEKWTIPMEIGNLNKLKILAIANSQLFGSLPLGMFNLTALQELYLQNNNLNGTILTPLFELKSDNQIKSYIELII